MYIVEYGNEFIFDPRVDELGISDATVTIGENAISYFDFTMYNMHPLYDRIQINDYDKPVRIYDDKELIFSGYATKQETIYDLSLSITCQDWFGLLKESVVRPYSTLKRTLGANPPSNMAGYFEWLIKQHNKQTHDNKHFVVGINQGLLINPRTYIDIHNDDYPTTYDELFDKILDPYGAVIRIREVNGIKYIDLLVRWVDVNPQILEFGVNITDYNQSIDSSNLVTAVIPVGCRLKDSPYQHENGYFVTLDNNMSEVKKYYTRDITFTKQEGLTAFKDLFTYYERFLIDIPGQEEKEEDFEPTGDNIPNPTKDYYLWDFSFTEVTEEKEFLPNVTYYEYSEAADESEFRLTLEGYPDVGVEDYKKLDDFVFSDSAVNTYGLIYKTLVDEELYTKDQLFIAGLDTLYANINASKTIDITAFDRKLIDKSLPPLRVGQYARVRSNPHNFDSYLLCTNVELDLNNPENNEYKLTSAASTSSGAQEFISSLNKVSVGKPDQAQPISISDKDKAIEL